MEAMKKNEIWHKGSLGVRMKPVEYTHRTHIAQRKHVIPHSMMKNVRSITLGHDVQ